MLKKENRLTKRKEFSFIYKKGDKANVSHLTMVFTPTKLANTKIGFSVSKKIGKAYQRNLVKRRLREIIKMLLPKIDNQYNYVFIAKIGICDLTYTQLQNQVMSVLNKSGKLKNE